MGVHDAVREAVVDRLVEDRAESGHGDEVHVVAIQRVDDLVGVGEAVEVGAEARALDDLDGYSGRFRALGGAARTVDDDHDDRAVRPPAALGESSPYPTPGSRSSSLANYPLEPWADLERFGVGSSPPR